ncbi:hypothetical protein L6164_025894 [Bauhinia variegata]|uniref:Uncharacterized protein n=1 Tax=Bauhinia variegata TaxID=167791 RepID=A0ACB9M3F5_BAUVA|nr:hypothetical protein L6164_025894 [Bauhinia variegata]
MKAGGVLNAGCCLIIVIIMDQEKSRNESVEEFAEQRKLNAALYHAKQLVELEAGSSIRGYILLAWILSAQKQFVEAEIVIDAALDQCGNGIKENYCQQKLS